MLVPLEGRYSKLRAAEVNNVILTAIAHQQAPFDNHIRGIGCRLASNEKCCRLLIQFTAHPTGKYPLPVSLFPFAAAYSTPP